MKRYMVVYSIPDEESVFEPGVIIKGNTSAAFFDDLGNASQFSMDCCLGLGGRAQVYEWVEKRNSGSYQFLME